LVKGRVVNNGTHGRGGRVNERKPPKQFTEVLRSLGNDRRIREKEESLCSPSKGET